MKNKLFHTTLIATSLLFATGYSNHAFAHNVLGSLGKAAGATDLYFVSCSNTGTGDSAYLAAQVKDLAPALAAKVSVQVIHGVTAMTSTDQKEDDANYSPLVRSYGGNDLYKVTVSKSGNGIENYDLEIHCESATGAHTGIDIQLVQNK